MTALEVKESRLLSLMFGRTCNVCRDEGKVDPPFDNAHDTTTLCSHDLTSGVSMPVFVWLVATGCVWKTLAVCSSLEPYFPPLLHSHAS